MGGLFILFVFAVWVLILIAVAVLVTKVLPDRWWKMVLRAAVVICLLPLPLADEILAKSQFEQLCRENSTIQVDREKAKGRTVYLYSLPETQIQNTRLPIFMHTWRFVDADTGESIVSYNTLRASGGRFISALGISEGNVPLVFRATCVPKNRPVSAETFKDFGINYIEPPKK